MRRREFLGVLGGAAAWPVVARAQKTNKVWRLGIISGGSRALVAEFADAFLQGMRDLDYIEGRDFITEWRYAEGNNERIPSFVAELVNSKVDMFVLTTAAAIRPVQTATSTIPVVMVNSTDPVGNGFVASLSRPGGNITGLASAADDSAPKQVELLTAVSARLTRIGYLTNPNNPNTISVFNKAKAAGQAAGVVVVPLRARSFDEIESAFTTLANEKFGAVMVGSDATFLVHREKIAQLALRAQLPSMFVHREYVQAGGLMSYGEDLKDFLRYSATFVDKIIRGAKASDLPVEQPTKFRFVINRKTADALGLAIPPEVYIFANEVIE